MSIINNIGLVNADLDLNLDLDKRVYRRRYESRRSSNLKLYLKKNKKWRKTLFNMADGILTPCNVARS